MTRKHRIEVPLARPLARAALVGRPNVGKSTLFNRLVQRRQALEHNLPGVTRDRLYGAVRHVGRTFEVIDTGGLEPGTKDVIKGLIARQVDAAIEEAAVLVLVVDATAGVTPLDRDVARRIRATGRPVVVAVNKVDTQRREQEALEFHVLGLGDPVWVSAAHGLNVDALLDRVVALLEQGAGREAASVAGGLRLAFVGKPNAGKSTLLNTLLGDQRLLVDSRPGTTRDAVPIPFQFRGRDYVLVDTAGMRRPARVSDPLERLAVAAAQRAIEACDIAVLVLDASRPMDAQDKRVAGLIQDSGRPCVIAVNKWDTVASAMQMRKSWDTEVRRGLWFLQFCPLVFISGLRNKHLDAMMSAVQRVDSARQTRVDAPMLRAMVKEAQLVQPAPAHGMRRLRIMDVCMAGDRPGTFVLRVNDPNLASGAYLRYIENTLRGALVLEGVPIRLLMTNRPLAHEVPTRAMDAEG